MQNRTVFIAITLVLSVFISCAPIKPIEYKSIDNFTISRVGLSPEFKADVHLFNPNKIGAKIKSMTLDVYVNDTKLSSVCMDSKTCIRAVGDFTVPVLAQPSLTDVLRMLPKGISTLFGSKDMPVTIKGEVVIKKFIFSKHYRFEVTEKLTKDKIKMLGNFGF